MYDNTATLKLNDHSGLLELAKMHRKEGIYDVSCAITSEERSVYHAFFKKDFGWSVKQIKSAIVKLRA